MSDPPRQWTGAIAHPQAIPKAEYVPFFENSIKLVACVGPGRDIARMTLHVCIISAWPAGGPRRRATMMSVPAPADNPG